MLSPNWKPEAVVLTTNYTVSSHPRPAAAETGSNHHRQEKRAPYPIDTINDKAEPYHLHMLVTVEGL